MKKYVLPVILISLVLSTIATATQVNEKMGPYSINFTTPANIYTKTEIQENLETFEGIKFQTYNLSIFSKKSNACVGSILITHFDSIINEDQNELADITSYDLVSTGAFKTVEIHTRTIDNITGKLLTCIKTDYPNMNPSMYQWMYSLNSQNKVIGTSILPWNNETSEILDTLHIDVIGN